mmetsp:Transcript_33634/g.97021  ORF Transcript_33634/g.97021 Transcript_33634/m.97021 type:complete len:680 (+) Transcript_33634:257-2296(+)
MFGLYCVTAAKAGVKLADYVSGTAHGVAVDLNEGTKSVLNSGVQTLEDAVHAVGANFRHWDPETWAAARDSVKSSSQCVQNVVSSIGRGINQLIHMSRRTTKEINRAAQNSLDMLDTGIAGALREAGYNITRMRKGGLFDVAHYVLDLAMPFSEVSPLELGRALVAFGTLQELAQAPYPRTGGTFIDCDLPENTQDINRLDRSIRMCMAAYPPPAMQICGLPIQAFSQLEFFEKLTGLSRDAILTDLPERTIEFLEDTHAASDAAEVKQASEGGETFHHSSSAPSVMKQYQKDGEGDVPLTAWVTSTFRPIYYTTLDHDRQEIGLTFRGTLSVADCLTDLCCQIEEGAHSGMVTSAQWFDEHLRDKYRRLADMYPTYNMVLQGHSLGGGVASLLALKWISDPLLGPKIHCVAFNPPCIVTLELAAASKDYITSIVHARDMVSRASIGSISNMQRVLLHLAGRRHTNTSTDNDNGTQQQQQQTTIINGAPPHVGDSRTEQASSGAKTTGAGQHQEPEPSASASAPPPKLADEPIMNPDKQKDAFASSAAAVCESDPMSEWTTDKVLKLVSQAKKHLSPATHPHTRQFWETQLRMALTALRTLYDDRSSVLCPAGRTILMLPSQHLARAGLPTPESGLTKGGYCAMEMGPEVLDLASEIIFHRGAFPDHNLVAVAKAFAFF